MSALSSTKESQPADKSCSKHIIFVPLENIYFSRLHNNMQYVSVVEKSCIHFYTSESPYYIAKQPVLKVKQHTELNKYSVSIINTYITVLLYYFTDFKYCLL